MRRALTYDARGRLASYTDQHIYADSTYEGCPPPEITCDPPPPGWTFSWNYVTVRSATYSPDNSGNRTDGSASLSNDRLSSMTGADAVSYSFSYDVEGRRTAKTASGYSQTYGWNGFGQLVWIKTNGDSIAYRYDAAGRRVRKMTSAGTTEYLWDGDNLLMELDGSGNRVRQYSYQAGIDRPVAVRISGTMYYYQLDEAGNVAAVWNMSNAKVATYTDDPYGYPIATGGSLTQPLRWKGREYDSETGLYYIRARYYDPTVGRFISEDPIGLAGGINPYAFADGEPANRSDPSGLEWICTGDYEEGTRKLGNPACFYQLDPMITKGYVPIGFKSSRGSQQAGGGHLLGGGGAAGRPSASVATCAAVPTFVGAAAGSSALAWYRSIWDDHTSSPLQKVGALAGGLFAALWTEDTAPRTTGALIVGYGARVTGPHQYLPKEGVPRPIARGRQTFRWDAPHHGKPWHLDGTITGKGGPGGQTLVDIVGCV